MGLTSSSLSLSERRFCCLMIRSCTELSEVLDCILNSIKKELLKERTICAILLSSLGFGAETLVSPTVPIRNANIGYSIEPNLIAVTSRTFAPPFESA